MTNLYNPGMRSKWSEDEDDAVKISASNENNKVPGKTKNSQDFPYPNAVDSKEGR